MIEIQHYTVKRKQYWDDIERFFSNLPAPLFRQAVLLRNALTVTYGECGYIEEILLQTHEYPLLSLHFWLLDDWEAPGGEDRDQIEQHVLAGMFFVFAAVYLREGMLDDATPFDDSYKGLEQRLLRKAILHFGHLFPEESPFWEYYDAAWEAYHESVQWEQREHGTQAVVFTEEDQERLADRFAYAKLAVIAVALKTGYEAIIPKLLTMVEQLSGIFRIVRDLRAIRRDLFSGNYTYPIVRIMLKGGISLQQPVVPENVLGAMILTGAIKDICQECLESLKICRAIAHDLQLATWLTYFDTLERLICGIMDLFSLGKTNDKAAGDLKIPMLPYVDHLGKAIEMAEGYLLSDPTFRESWEIQREGKLGVPEWIARAFPTGIILELLCANGHDLSYQIDEVFGRLHESGFRYYENAPMPPDTDDIGLLLRLYQYSGHKEIHQKMLRKPLGWLKKNILPSGEIPVFWTRGVGLSGYSPDELLAWGQSCAIVEANILLGLIAYDWNEYSPIIEQSALNVCERFIRNGVSNITHYDLLYALWVSFTLMAQLSAHPISAPLSEKIEQVRPILLKRAAQESRQRHLSPQSAAFLSLMCMEHDIDVLCDPEWIAKLLKQQRYDGSWDDEPLFPSPNRTLITWYSSRAMTTAFCYHALRTYQQAKTT